MRVAIIGTGYVGLTTGVCLAYAGHSVTCLDADRAKVQSLCTGKIPIYEPYLDDLLAEARPNLKFTTSYADAIPRRRCRLHRRGHAVHTVRQPRSAISLASRQSIGRTWAANSPSWSTNRRCRSAAAIGWTRSFARPRWQRGRRLEGVRRRFESRISARRRGHARHALPRPHRHRRRRSARLDVLYSLYRPILDQTFLPPTFSAAAGRQGRGAAGLDRPGLGGADQVRRQRVSGRRKSALSTSGAAGGAGGCGYHRGGARHRARFTHRLAVSERRAGLGRLVLRQGHGGADHYGRRVRPDTCRSWKPPAR